MSNKELANKNESSYTLLDHLLDLLCLLTLGRSSKCRTESPPWGKAMVVGREQVERQNQVKLVVPGKVSVAIVEQRDRGTNGSVSGLQDIAQRHIKAN